MENKINNNDRKIDVKPTFWKLFWLFLKISFFSFGGGNAMFPIIRSYCVEKYNWISDQDIDDILIVTNSIPGASSIEAIAYISNLLLKSKWKSFIVTIISLLPHTLFFILIFTIGHIYVPSKYLKVIYVAIIPIIIGLLLNMTIRYLKANKKDFPITIHWLLFVVTLSFSVFVPTPWNIPIFVIIFFIICLLIFNWIKFRKKGKQND